MKKLLLLFALLCSTITSWASVFDWEAPDEGKYSGSSPVIVYLNVNGIKVDRESRYSLPVYLGNIYAFVDGECRAVSYDMVEDQDFFLLNVQGNTREVAGQPSDSGKEIEFRMEALDLVYTFTKTVKFTGERQEITLNLDAVTNIKLPQEGRMDIVKDADEFPFSFDVKDSLVYVYEGKGCWTFSVMCTLPCDRQTDRQKRRSLANCFTRLSLCVCDGKLAELHLREHP